MSEENGKLGSVAELTASPVSGTQLRVTEADSGSTVHLVERLNTVIVHGLLTSGKLILRNVMMNNRQCLYRPQSGDELTAFFILTQVEMYWNGTSSEAVPHSTSYRPGYSLGVR